MDVTVELHCDRCGSANLAFPEDEAAGEIACNDCGEKQGGLAELAEELMRCARAHSAGALREGLDRPN